MLSIRFLKKFTQHIPIDQAKIRSCPRFVKKIAALSDDDCGSAVTEKGGEKPSGWYFQNHPDGIANTY
jgi:hypothetical protein